jgi:hypothetical protein
MTPSLALGQDSVTAVYGGDANNDPSTSAVLIQTINAPDFTLTPNPASATTTAGQPATFTVTIAPQGSFTSTITFSCTGLPALASCIFSPTTVTPNGGVSITTLEITSFARTASVAPPPFGHRSTPLYAMWLALPTMLLVSAGMAVPNRRRLLSYCLVLLLLSGCLLQMACGSSGNSVSGRPERTPAGTYDVTISGTASSTQHAVTVTLTVL